jgi:hypothetical protein
MGERRRHARTSYIGRVTLSWTADSGVPTMTRGECLDLSRQGMRVRAGSPIPLRTYVSIRLDNSNLFGTASIRSCRHEKLAYILGLEFTGGLCWDALPQTAAT